MLSTETDGPRPEAAADAESFTFEMRRVFETGWVFLAHESELPAAGDYKTCLMGAQPVVVTRHEDGRIHALLNRCRHRGMVVCRAATGHSHYLRCAYHNWTYACDGRLVGVAEADGYPDDFDTSTLGLVALPRLASYRGLVFGSLADKGRSLEEHLASQMPAIDAWAGDPAAGDVHVLPAARKVALQCHWKTSVGGIAAELGEGVYVFPNLFLTGSELAVMTPVDAATTHVSRHRVVNG